MLAFIKEIYEVESKNPEGKVEKNVVEIRHDPLTGRKTRINVNRAKRPHVSGASIKKSESKKEIKGCIFCKERWEETLQRFGEREGMEGQWIKVGKGKNEVVLFPNKFPFARRHVVVVLGGDHAVKLSKISEKTWVNAFLAISQYYQKLTRAEGKHYIYINLNFLPPSGASIEHPHMQIVCEQNMLSAHEFLLGASRRFERKHGMSYWKMLVEKDKERFVGDGDYFSFVCAFAPIANAETYGVGVAKPFHEHDEDEIKAMAVDFGKMMKCYEKTGFRSMNATIMFPLKGSEAETMPALARFIARPEPKEGYTADRGFMEIFYDEAVVHTLPEELAETLRKFW